MKNSIPVVTSEAIPENTIFILPRVRPVVYLKPGQHEAISQQERDAITDAYIQAAKRGEVAINQVHRAREPEGK